MIILPNMITTDNVDISSDQNNSNLDPDKESKFEQVLAEVMTPLISVIKDQSYYVCKTGLVTPPILAVGGVFLDKDNKSKSKKK